jgi:hypothetical protein
VRATGEQEKDGRGVMRAWRAATEARYLDYKCNGVFGKQLHHQYTHLSYLIVLLASITLSLLVGFTTGSVWAAGGCGNESIRVEQGSTYLPDCRAYELVTPTEKGSTQDLSFERSDHAIIASNGERIALTTTASLGERPGSRGSRALFSRTATGWTMASYQAADSGEVAFEPTIFSADLSQVGGVASLQPRLFNDTPDQVFEAGPPGGPYTPIATTPFNQDSSHADELLGASNDFSHIVLASTDSDLPSTEGVNEGVDKQADDLYEWNAGILRKIINITNSGHVISPCGATLGFGSGVEVNAAHNAISNDGSKIFFTAPDPEAGEAGELACKSPFRLYMRVDGAETVEVSAPASGVTPSLAEEETLPVIYQGASEDGSKVFFSTRIELTANDTTHTNELYEYNTISRSLTRISRGESGVADGEVVEGPGIATITNDGSTVYFRAKGRLTFQAPAVGSTENNLYRYETGSGSIKYVATVQAAANVGERPYTTDDGQFLLFVSDGVLGEPRGENHREIYRYNVANGSRPLCVSCGPSTISVTGNASLPTLTGALREPPNATPQFIPMSSNGRYVFFDTTARLVPEDTNSIAESTPEGGQPPGQDVYEWEEDGVGDCGEATGCVHLISSGLDENYSVLLGASADGSNVFFATAARLVPQDKDDLGDIYDARVGGGFAASPPPVQCSGEACRLIPIAPPLISTPLSETFFGVGNLVMHTSKIIVRVKSKPKKHSKSMFLSKRKRKKTRVRNKGGGAIRNHRSAGVRRSARSDR